MESGDLNDKEGLRQLVELATSCGRKHQNEQTSFVHFCYTREDEKDNGTIPIYENLLFALALMRSKSADTVQEGKGIVEKILPFQNLTEEIGKGSFPIYLHEYPHCKDRLLGIKLLPIFYAILSQFHHVIGASLKNKIIEATRLVLKQAHQTNQERAVSYTSAVTLGFSSVAIGQFLDDAQLTEDGRAVLHQLEKPDSHTSWYSPVSLGELFIALQMSDTSLLTSEWDSFWPYLSETWHRSSCSYFGPGIKELQYGTEPQATVYDLYMGFATGSYSYRSFVDNQIQLQGALIYKQVKTLPSPSGMIKGQIEDARWFASQNQNYAVCLLGKTAPIDPHLEKGYIPFKIVWGDKTRAHTFVCQGGNMQTVSYDWHPDGYLSMEILLGEIPQTEDKEKAREIIFFTEALEDTQLLVKGLKATTFNFGEDVSLCCGGLSLSLNIEILEGDGSFIGHIMKGNRPAQMELKGAHRFQAFDWQIFMRTVYRTSPCRVKVNIQIKQVE